MCYFVLCVCMGHWDRNWVSHNLKEYHDVKINFHLQLHLSIAVLVPGAYPVFQCNIDKLCKACMGTRLYIAVVYMNTYIALLASTFFCPCCNLPSKSLMPQSSHTCTVNVLKLNKLALTSSSLAPLHRSPLKYIYIVKVCDDCSMRTRGNLQYSLCVFVCADFNSSLTKLTQLLAPSLLVFLLQVSNLRYSI